MDEEKAEAGAAWLGGYAWHSGGGIHLVVMERKDGARIVISEELVCEYADEAAVDSRGVSRRCDRPCTASKWPAKYWTHPPWP